MPVLEITIQRRIGGEYPVVAEYSRSGSLTQRSEGMLSLDDEMQLRLLAMQLDAYEYGAMLGRALFLQDIRDEFQQARADSPEHLRTLLVVEDEKLQTLHWEWLAAPLGPDGRWEPLALNQRTPFSRYLPSVTDRRFPNIGRRDLRALILVASPRPDNRYGREAFDEAATVAAIQASLDGVPYDTLANVDGAAGPPTLDALCTQLTAQPYTLLHIVAHGVFNSATGETLLFLQAADGQAAAVSATTLVQRLNNLQGVRGLPQLVFLAACESAAPAAEHMDALGGLGQRLVRDVGTPAVVAMTQRVSVATAQALATSFYAQLRSHGEPDRALVEASAGLQGAADVAVPALFSRLGDRPLFSDRRPLHELANSEIEYGLQQLELLLPPRAPVLLEPFVDAATQLRSTLGAEESMLSPIARSERQQRLAEIDALSSEVLDLSFAGLALGELPTVYDHRCPFMGLVAFKLDNQQFFFGREKLVEEVVGLLHEHPFLALLGPSGSGKSSLLLAGIVPALQRKMLHLEMRYLTPTADPVQALDNALSRPSQLPDAPYVLVVDQFEELFTLCNDDTKRLQFIDRLLGLISTGSEATLRPGQPAPLKPKWLLLTLRVDFRGDCTPYAALVKELDAHQKTVDPMTPQELRGAIDEQAKMVRLRFEADLAQTILDDVEGEPGAMPLLQHTLLELWRHRHGRWLLRAEYRQMGGARQAIARTAENAYLAGDLNEQDRAQIRNIFLRLTRLDPQQFERESERRYMRRRVRLDDLVPGGSNLANTRRLVTRLADLRLVVTSRIEQTPPQEEVDPAAAGNTLVEVAHEALIVHWERLRAWLDKDWEFLVWQQRVGYMLAEYERGSGMLLSGAGLIEAENWLGKQRDLLNQRERAYIEASLRQRRLTRTIRLAVLSLFAAIGVAATGYTIYLEALKYLARGPVASFLAGSAVMGSTNPADSTSYPTRTVTLDAFAIDQYEVTNLQYRRCMRAGACTRPFTPALEPAIENAPEDHPVDYVNAYQADAFCDWIGRRLPSAAQWERAARGVEGRIWPWESKEAPTPAHANVNFGSNQSMPPEQPDREEPPLPDNLPFDVLTPPPGDLGTIIITTQRGAKVAVADPAFAKGATPEDVTHMVGNVAEWTSTTSDCRDLYTCEQLWDGVKSVTALNFRGLSYHEVIEENDLTVLSRAVEAEPSYFSSGLGFRCAE